MPPELRTVSEDCSAEMHAAMEAGGGVDLTDDCKGEIQEAMRARPDLMGAQGQAPPEEQARPKVPPKPFFEGPGPWILLIIVLIVGAFIAASMYIDGERKKHAKPEKKKITSKKKLRREAAKQRSGGNLLG